MAFGEFATLLDDFNRANENPLSGGGNWAKLNSADGTDLQLISNAVASNAATTGSRYWTPSTFGPNVEAYFTITVKPANTEAVFVLARLQGVGGSNTWDGYQVRATAAAGTDTIAIISVTNNTGTQLASVDQEFAVGDKIGIRCLGTAIEGWYNTGGTWTRVVEIEDSTYSAAGNVGMRASATATRIDDFFAGTVLEAKAPWLTTL